MRFEKLAPSSRLQPFIRHFVISETDKESEYKVMPTAGLVIGFQFKGNLAYLKNGVEDKLAPIGITGLQNQFKIFHASANIGSILVFFNEIGASYFFKNPVHELFNQSLSLDYLIAKAEVEQVHELLSLAETDQQRLLIVENFLFQQLLEKQEDVMVTQAVRYIHQVKGSLKIKQLSELLSISQSPLEKRFRKIVGTSPKKFASIVRFNNVVKNLEENKPFALISYENNYFDQAHLIHDFKNFSGETPDKFLK